MNEMNRPIASGPTVQTVSTEEMYQVITGASSQDPTVFQASGKRLKEMLEMFGAYDALHEIAAQRNVPVAIRQQSIIQFKNAALPHWRSRKILSDEQRVRIRQRCFSFLDEPDETIADCNQVIVSKIARIDFPVNWSNLVDELLKIIDTTLTARSADPANDNPQNVLVLKRSLKLFNGIIKELAAVKMPSGVKTMAMVLTRAQGLLAGYYSALMFSSYITPDMSASLSIRGNNDILLAHLVYKPLSKLAVWLWNRLDKGGREGLDLEAGRLWVGSFVEGSKSALQQLVAWRITILQSYNTNPFAVAAADTLTRHIRLLGKLFRRLQELSAARFTTIPCSAELVAYYWQQVVQATQTPALIKDSPEAVYPVRFLVQGMVLFKENLAQWKPVRNDGSANPASLSADDVRNAIETLITQFMPLKEAELEDWVADPEQWVNDEVTENDQWQFEIRPCSERVLMQLATQFPDIVRVLLLQLYNNSATQIASDLAGVVKKEALYCAIGRCALRLKDAIPYEAWLQTTLAEEAKSTNPAYPIIKRRIAWLLGKWASQQCISPTNPLLWQVLMHLLRDRGPGSDPVVRLTAAFALREAVDTLEFDINVFSPFLPDAVSELVRLLGEADTLEIKRKVDYALNVVIEQSGERISELMHIIATPLPDLWMGATAAEDWLFKSTLLETLAKLVEAIKAKSAPLAVLVQPLVTESLAPGAATHLDEDAMALWVTFLRNAGTLPGDSPMLNLFPTAIYYLSNQFDILGKTLNIVESYLLLDCPHILRNFSRDLFAAFVKALQSSAIVAVNSKDILLTINLIVQLAPAELWGEAMHATELFAHLMSNVFEGECGALLLTEHILLMARIVMADRQMFLQLMGATATPALTEQKLYEKLLDQWWGTWDNMSEPRYRKLSAMGIAALVSTARPDVLERLPGDIFNIWTDVLLELKEAQEAPQQEFDTNDGDAQPLNLLRHWEFNEAPTTFYDGTEGTPEYERRKMVYERDPVRTFQLTAYIQEHLAQARNNCGPDAFDANYFNKADPAVREMIQKQLS